MAAVMLIKRGLDLRCRAAVLAGFVLAATAASQPVGRGLYYRSAETGVEFWVPSGLLPDEPPPENTHGRWIARAPRGGIHGLALREVRPDPGEELGRLDFFVEYWKHSARDQFESVEVEVVRDVRALGRTGVLVLFRNLTGDKSHPPGAAFVHAGFPLDSGSLLDLIFYFQEETRPRAVPEMHWILSTLRFSHDEGLDRWLGPRVVDRASGFSFRPPRSLEAAASDGVIHFARSQDATLSIVGPLTGEDPGTAPAGLEAVGSAWSSPHESLALVARYFASGERAEAVVLVSVSDHRSFLIRCAGTPSAGEHLIRTAELVGMSVRYIDPEEARCRVESALDELSRALARGSRHGIESAVNVLIDSALVAAATNALIKFMPRLDDEELQVRAARALDISSPEVAVAVMRLTREPRVRKRPAVTAALLAVLGPVRQDHVKTFLLRQAGDRQSDPRVVAAAIGALGHHRGDTKVVREVIGLFQRWEAAGERADAKAREDWATLRPVFVDCLEHLTGNRLATAAEAEAWLKGSR